jgi:hypothetical protein
MSSALEVWMGGREPRPWAGLAARGEAAQELLQADQGHTNTIRSESATYQASYSKGEFHAGP